MPSNTQTIDLIRWAIERAITPALRGVVRATLDRRGKGWWNTGVLESLKDPRGLENINPDFLNTDELTKKLDPYALLRVIRYRSREIFGYGTEKEKKIGGRDGYAQTILDIRNGYSHPTPEEGDTASINRAGQFFETAYDFLKLINATDALAEVQRYEQWLDRLQARSTPLVSGKHPAAALIGGLYPGMASTIIQAVEEYIGSEMAQRPFAGRKWTLDQIDAWLASDSDSYQLIVADAGRGKSALVMHWAQRVAAEGRADVVLVPIGLRYNTERREAVKQLMIERLIYLDPLEPDLPTTPESRQDLIVRTLYQGWGNERPLLIILDGADEVAADWSLREIGFPKRPGHNVKVLITARATAAFDWRRELGLPTTTPVLDLPNLTRQGIEQGVQFARPDMPEISSWSQKLEELTQGDPLLLGLYLADLSESAGSRLTLHDLQAAPAGLDGYLKRWWDDQRRLWGEDRAVQEPAVSALFELLACTSQNSPVDAATIDYLNLSELSGTLAIDSALTIMRRFITGDPTTGYRFSHPRLQDFFRERLSQCKQNQWRDRFRTCGEHVVNDLTSGKLRPEQAPAHIVRYYTTYLSADGTDDQCLEAIACREWMLACQHLDGSYDGFLHDLQRVSNAAERTLQSKAGTPEAERAVGLLCRCALIKSTLDTISTDISSDLLLLLVRYHHNGWSVSRVIAYTKIWCEEDRRGALLVNVSELPVDDHDRQELLRAAASFTGLSWRDSLRIPVGSAKNDVTPSGRDPIPPHHDGKYKMRTFVRQQKIPTICWRGKIFAANFPHLTSESRQQALENFLIAEEPASRVQLLNNFIKYLPEVHQTDVAQQLLDTVILLPSSSQRLENLLMAEEPASRTQLLDMLIKYLPEAHRVDVAQRLLDTVRLLPSSSQRLSLLIKHFHLLHPEARTQATEMALEATQAMIIADDWISMQPALRVQKLISLVSIFDKHWESLFAEQAIAEVNRIEDPIEQTQIFHRIASHCSGEHQNHVLERVHLATQTIEDPLEQTWARAALLSISNYPDSEGAAFDLIASLLNISQKHSQFSRQHQEKQQSGRIALMLPTKQTLRSLLLKLLPTLGNQYDDLISEIIEKLDNGLPSELAIFTRRRTREDDRYRLPSLIEIASVLHSERLRQAVLQRVDAIENVTKRVGFLIKLIEQKPEHGCSEYLAKAISYAQMIDDLDQRAKILARLIPLTEDSVQRNFLAQILRIRQGSSLPDVHPIYSVYGNDNAPPIEWELSERINILVDLATKITIPEQVEVARAACIAIQAVREKLSSEKYSTTYPARHDLGVHVYRLMPTLMSVGLSNIAIDLLDCLPHARIHDDDYGGSNPAADMLVALAPYVSANNIEVIESEVKYLDERDERVRVLCALAEHCPKDQYRGTFLSQALAESQILDDNAEQAALQAAILPYLDAPERSHLLSRVFTQAKTLPGYESSWPWDDGNPRAKGYLSLAPFLGYEDIAHVLDYILSLRGDENNQPGYVEQLAPHLPDTLLPRLLQTALYHPNLIDIGVNELERRGQSLPVDMLDDLIDNILDDDNERLLAWVVHLLPDHLLYHLVTAIRQRKQGIICARLLSCIVPYLDEILQRQLVQEISDTLQPYDLDLKDGEQEAAPVDELRDPDTQSPSTDNAAPSLSGRPGEPLIEALLTMLKPEAEKSRSTLLRSLQMQIPLINALGGRSALVQLAETTLEIRNWAR